MMWKRIIKTVLLTLLLCVLGVSGYYGFRAWEMKKAPDPKIVAVKYLESICSGDYKTASELTDGGSFSFTSSAETVEGKMLAEMIRASRSYEITSCIVTGYRKAEVDVTVKCVNRDKLSEGLAGDVNAILAEMVENATFSSEIYNADLSYKSDVVYAAFDRAIHERNEHIEDYSVRVPVILYMDYDGDNWHIQKSDTLRKVYSAFTADETPDEIMSELISGATLAPLYVRKEYSLDDASPAPVPDRSLFGETDDPAVIEELIATPIAQQLLEGQELLWNRSIERIPGSVIRYYLDETILVLQWEEEVYQAVGTFTEIKIADGSQLRRKLVNDTFDADRYVVATELAAQSNAVMALSGDFYDLYGRDCGIVVYDREICRYEPYKIDTCYINGSGDMLFSYQGQLADIEEAKCFVEENDVRFSLCFGPILIDDHKNVTPDYYFLGEANDTYPRCALGQLGECHYLTCNINIRLNSQYLGYTTVKQLGEVMEAHRCQNAYTLDGGQTASTIINNVLVNDVQFGEERPMSDIIYFATAMPEA